jgi:eukaryotic-like serine/threonine-protein kinase
MDTLIGKSLTHYRIVEKIGAGGMGEVYLARDERLHRKVAVKVLRAGLLADDEARRRFRREARALSQLSHPHIAVLHDYDTAENVDFLVMELIEGETLAARLARGPLPEPEILRLGIEISHGLEAAHQHGILHRDLKPSNLIVTPEGDLKILDFGLAQIIGVAGQPATETVTVTQALVGTLPYMAPERLLGEAGDTRSDLYALGVVLYEMATGKRPFGDKPPVALAHDIGYTEPEPPRKRRPGLSEGLERIIRKGMARDPALRYQTAREMGADLGRGPDAVGTGSPEAARRSPRIVAAISLAGGAVVLVTALAILMNVVGVRDRLLVLPAPAALQSLAVLPLVNLSRDPDQEYFSDGLTEELISSLAQVSSLRVISRASVMMLKGSEESPGKIADRIGVDHIVEGSVLRLGDRVKVSAELIGVRPERVLWARSFEGQVRDLLTLQSNLAQAIVQEVRARLTPKESERLAHPRPVDPAAHEAYLRGVYYWAKRDSAQVRKAMNHFREAVRIDPTYATGWVGVAQGYYALSNAYLPPRVAIPLVRAAAERAISLDPNLPDGHTYLGVVLAHYEWKWREGEREYLRAIQLNPNSAEAHQWLGYALMWQAHLDAALREYEMVGQLDPLAGDQAGSIAWCYYMAGRYDAAIERFKHLLEVDPSNADQHAWLGLCYFRKSMPGPALEELRRGAELSDHAWPRAQLAYVEALLGRRADAEAILGKLLHPPHGEFFNNYSIALTYVALGDRSLALRWLEKGYEARDEDLALLNVDPAWVPLRSDPRFHDLLIRLGFKA